MATEFKSINTGSIANGSSDEETWTPNRDITIKKMMLIERSDVSLSNAQVYITIAGEVYTKDFVPGSVIGADPEYCWKPDLKVSKGAEIYVKVTNNTGSSINCDIVFEYE